MRAVHLRSARQLVTKLIERDLRRQGLPPAAFDNLRSQQQLKLTTIADRSVRGCMNDIALLCEAAISDAGGLAHTDVGELNHALHRNINSSRSYRPPVEPHNSLSLGGQPSRKGMAALNSSAIFVNRM